MCLKLKPNEKEKVSWIYENAGDAKLIGAIALKRFDLIKHYQKLNLGFLISTIPTKFIQINAIKLDLLIVSQNLQTKRSSLKYSFSSLIISTY